MEDTKLVGPKDEVFDSQLKPLVEKIFEICKAHNIPFLTAFYAHNGYYLNSGGHPEEAPANFLYANALLKGVISVETELPPELKDFVFSDENNDFIDHSTH
jgi:hypothetical protein